MNVDPEVKWLGFDAESLFPLTRQTFRVDETAKILNVSATHVFDLIIDGLIRIPKKRIDSAPSRSSILIPRDSLVRFVNLRRNSTERLEAKAAARAKARNGKQRKGGPR